MSLIACTSDCVYQKDGTCTLTRAASPGEPNKDGCAYYVKASKGKK